MQLNFNTDQLKKRLKENIERNIDKNIVAEQQIHDAYFSNIEKLIELHNISEVHYFSHRKFLGKIIITFKKVVRKLIRPILNKQIIFNQLMIENVRYLQQLLKDNQAEQIKQIEELLSTSIDEIVNDIKTQESMRDGYLSEVAASNNNLEQNFNKLKDDINMDTDTKISTMMNQIESQRLDIEKLEQQIHALTNQIELQKLDVEKLNEQVTNISQIEGSKNQFYKIKEESVKEASKNILIELSDFHFQKNEYDLSYQLLLSALKFDPNNLELEGRMLSVFETLNKSRNLQ
ncbi:hypothetical protein [Paenibacillus sp. UNC451MF]|uniref:hypothetical protein n=1 Tax=Paenibacillus sp. UNC451MF TaxID=1449063 RepID=UPI00048B54F1|nr:hypothetical protein [Paenibacillus sp. UNC451MF]